MRAHIPDKVKNNSGDQSTTPDMQRHGNSKQDSVVLIQTEQFQHSMLVKTLKIKQESILQATYLRPLKCNNGGFEHTLMVRFFDTSAMCKW
jgi:hypothetical protein